LIMVINSKNIMKDKIYLVISPNRVERMVKNPPSLRPNEIFITLDVSIPQAVFKRPTFQGNINVTEEDEKFELEITQIEKELNQLKSGGE